MNGWGFTDRPCVTLGNATFRGLVGGTGAKAAIMNAYREGNFVPSPLAKNDGHAEITRITVEEAAILQTYPRDFKFAGNRGKQGLQIGNAVPPLLAQRVLEHLWKEDA